MHLRQAEPSEAAPLWALYQRCIAALRARGIRQWDEKYPTRVTLEEAVTRRDLFVLEEDGAVVGAVVLNELAAPEYGAITWTTSEPALIVHGLVLEPALQGRGLGRAALQVCEEHALRGGHASVRLDAYPGNATAMSLYRRCGYRECGEVRFEIKPPGCDRYAVFEKPLL